MLTDSKKFLIYSVISVGKKENQKTFMIKLFPVIDIIFVVKKFLRIILVEQKFWEWFILNPPNSCLTYSEDNKWA